MNRPALSLVLLCFSFGAGAQPASAQWPYRTEEASNLVERHYSLSLGLGRYDRRTETRFYGKELLTPPVGVYLSIPEVQGTLGVGSRAEVSFDYEFLVYRPPGGGSNVTETGDLRLWTKLGLVRGKRQDLSVRFGVKLPNANRLGTNETDFLASGLYDLRVGQWVATANLGFAVFGTPAQERVQDDLLTWALALRWTGSGDGFRGGAEAEGYSGPFGLDRRRDARTYAGVLGWQWGRWAVDGAARYGVHDAEGWGWQVGATYSH